MLERKKKSLIAVLRVTAQVVNGERSKMLPMDVLNTHWEFAEQSADRIVCWSTNVQIDAKYLKDIEKVLFFSAKEDWVVEAEVVKIVAFKNPANPTQEEIKTEWCPRPFPEPRYTWIALKNFREVKKEDITYHVLGKNIPVSEQLSVPRFTRCYAEE